jgi:N-acetylglucosaminyldiphosphoundecaprenol N-acetyl-beta-D-mannosaminyltransferase
MRYLLKLEYLLHKTFKRTSNECSNQIIKHIKNKNKKIKFLSTINTNSLLVIQNDNTFKKALMYSNWLIPDGYGAVIACKLLGLKIRERITGSDIFNEINYKLNKHINYNCVFLGSTKKTLKLIVKKMKLNYPNIKIKGCLSPPFKNIYSTAETNKMINFINKKKPDILWVGLTQPKQEKWIYENFNKLDTKFVGAIGAVFDFYPDLIKRAPIIVQDFGLEWLYRIIQDPKRLWKRYLFCNLNFIFIILPYLLYVRVKYIINFK